MADDADEVRGNLPILAFADRQGFEQWIEEQGALSAGIWLKFAKKSAIAASISKPEAIDVALCHGWIDGQLDKYDEHYFLTRFTPRRPRSRWSQVNRRRVEELEAEGRLRPAGAKEVAAAKADGRWEAAYAPASTIQVPDDLQAALDACPPAAAFFRKLTGARRYAILYRIGSVKRPETRARKIAEFTATLARGETVGG